MDAIAALMSRASPVSFSDKPVDQSALDVIIAAGLKAPDHGRLRPWRIIVVQGDARHRLGERVVEIMRRRNPGVEDAAVQREKGKLLRAPVIIIVAATPKESKNVPPVEQVVSAGAVAQNIQLAAHALGLGAFWRTGAAAYDEDMKGIVGLTAADTLVGYLYVGHVGSPGTAKPPVPAGVVEEWPGR